MLKEIYLAIAAKLALIVDKDSNPIFRHIELYNNQWQYLDKIKPMKYPCCLIEFTDIPFEQMSNKVQQANTMIRLHVASHGLQDNKYGSTGHEYTLDHLVLVDIVNKWMSGFNGTNFNSFTRIGLSTDHDHDSVIVHVITYRTRVEDSGAIRATIKLEGDKLVILPEID